MQQVSEETAQLHQRIVQLEDRVEKLEKANSTGALAAAKRARAPVREVLLYDWTTVYEVALLDAGETWIEMHEPSARGKLHRLIVEVVQVEGPVTEQLALHRVREAWGLKRAGARIQEVFEQATRQLAAQEKLVRAEDGVLSMIGQELATVRVPGVDEDTRRSVEEIPVVELELALTKAARHMKSVDADELTMVVANLFGWTRRGTEIQTRLDACIQRLVDAGKLVRDDTMLRPG